MPLFSRIGQRLLFVVGFVVLTGLLGVVLLYGQRQESSILEQNEKALSKVTHSVAEGLHAIMLNGYADIARNFAIRLKALKDVVDYRIMRVDGVEAFIDNDTITLVNQYLGSERFKPRKEELAPLIMSPEEPHFKKLLQSGQRQIYYENLPSGERIVTVLEPIHFGATCSNCHAGQIWPTRGVVKLSSSLQSIDQAIAQTRWKGLGVLVFAVLLIFITVYFIAKYLLTLPIQRITKAMAVATQGDLSVKVQVAGRDEIGGMAESFNAMNQQLLLRHSELEDEQNKLTTIILGAREGIVVTDAQGQVVLVNPAATILLGKSEARITDEGLLNLFDNPAWMKVRLDSAQDAQEFSATSLLEYNNCMLSILISAICNTAGAFMGSAVILRNVTEEKRLQQELKRMAMTDVLTGLGNRRHFDEYIEIEYQRARRYSSVYAVLLLDIDLFKAFNDAHGHDCGDRVLESIGTLLRQLPICTATICRYGGEELALVLPDVSSEEAMRVGELVRKSIAFLRVDGLQVTVSIGVAVFSTDMSCAEEIVTAADDALYLAKEEGRNRVILAST